MLTVSLIFSFSPKPSCLCLQTTVLFSVPLCFLCPNFQSKAGLLSAMTPLVFDLKTLKLQNFPPSAWYRLQCHSLTNFTPDEYLT